MDRYNRGMPLEGRKNPIYHNGEFPDIAGLDLADIQALKRQAAAQVEEYKRDLDKQEAEKRSAKERALNEKIAELQKQLSGNEQQKQNNSPGYIEKP